MRNNSKKNQGFEALNKDIFGLVFAYLPTQALHRSAQVNKHWNQVVALFEERNETRFRNQFPEIHAIIKSKQHKVKNWRKEFFLVAKFSTCFPVTFKKIKRCKKLIKDWEKEFKIQIKKYIKSLGDLIPDKDLYKKFYISIAESDVNTYHKIMSEIGDQAPGMLLTWSFLWERENILSQEKFNGPMAIHEAIWEWISKETDDRYELALWAIATYQTENKIKIVEPVNNSV